MATPLSVPLTRSAIGRKQHAAQCFRSQFEPLELHQPLMLPPIVLRRLLAVGDPLTGDAAHEIIAGTTGLTQLGRYLDDDVVIEMFDTCGGRSVAARKGVPGADES